MIEGSEVNANGQEPRCDCRATVHATRFVVLTGGPGAGKTAVLEIARRNFCKHVTVLPEAAGIVFGGGFWRRDTPPARRAAQRAIFCVQREIERLIIEEQETALALCDRGTVDGLAYWPDSEQAFWRDLRTSRELEHGRYAAVIHLKSPSEAVGYNHQNPLRTESAAEAQRIDDRILAAWEGHPHLYVVESTANFLDKARVALELIRRELPQCCRLHGISMDISST
jgi:predicted ATPase